MGHSQADRADPARQAQAEQRPAVDPVLESKPGGCRQPPEVVVTASGVVTKWDFDLFRDALNNVNQTLRYQISLGVPLIAACIAVLNVVPPQAHQELLNEVDRWVFIPAVLGMGVAYVGIEQWWYLDKKRTKPVDDLESLYALVKHKYRMMHWAICLQGLALCLLILFVLLEFK